MTETTPDFKEEAEKLGDETIEFLVDEEDLPIHEEDRFCVIADIQSALISAYNKGYAHAKT